MSNCEDERYWTGLEGFKEVLAQEHKSIAKRTNRSSKEAWTGISLSGGGIRSASFCLGGLQALAHFEVLSKIDYISTVSGGGYIGAGLQWLLCRDCKSDASGKGFPYGVDADLAVRPSGQTNLQYLRWHANYLLPGKGLDIFSAITVVVRTAFLSIGIWFPLIVLFFYSLQSVASFQSVQEFVSSNVPAGIFPFDFMQPSWTGDNCSAETMRGRYLWPDKIGCFSIFYALSLFATCIGVALLAILSLLVAFVSVTKFPQQLTTRFAITALLFGALGVYAFYIEFGLLADLMKRLGSPDPGQRTPITTVDFVTALVLLTLGSISVLPAINLTGLLVFGSKYKNADYGLRRFFEVVGGKLLRFTLFAFIFASIPVVHKLAFGSTPIPASSVSIISGLVTAVVGHLGQSKQIKFGLISQFAMAFSACVFLYSVMLLAYHASEVLFNPKLAEDHYYYGLFAAGIAVTSTIFGITTNSNTIGLHRFYRDRLMELFMPSADGTSQGRSTYSFEADRLSISECWEKRCKKAVALFPIVNCNAILVNDKNSIISRRGGASFAVTPLHIGGSEHGWERTKSYELKNRELSLATAVAASGAAANSNSGYAGTGITRNRAVSLVLTLFNTRLGVWVRRPSKSSSINLLKPTPFFPNLWYGPLSKGYTAKSAFVEISDGGHFENLGIYELVRRKVDLIIAFDGEADPTTSLPALVSLSRRIEEDFSATIEFDTSVNEIMPFGSETARYPNDAKFASVPCVKATISYKDSNKTTTLIYVKATLIETAAFGARGYRAQHPDYPNESTANQFYSPEQFDAYRELGIACATKALELHGQVIRSILQRREPCSDW
jgi:FtsH-binding integral membrane protein